MTEAEFAALNRRRGELIDRDLAGTITVLEAEELAVLEAAADAHVARVAPFDWSTLERLERIAGLEQPPLPPP